MDRKVELIKVIDELTEQGKGTRFIMDAVHDKFGEIVSYRQMRRYMTGARGNMYREVPKLDYLQPAENAKRTDEQYSTHREQLKMNQDGSQEHATVIAMKHGEEKDPVFVLRAHGYDPDEWQIISVVNNFWQQGSAENGTRDLYQSKVTVKPVVKDTTIEDFKNALNGKIQPIKIVQDKSGLNTMLISLFDIHFGITTIGMMQDKLKQIDLLLQSGYKNVEIIVGGDFLHSDFMSKTQTAKNTQLDHVDQFKSLADAEQFLGHIIESSLTYSDCVKVHAISGNHDEDKQYLFIWGMEERYPQVEFENELNTRLAFQFGKIGVLVAHGNLALKRLPMLFATEYPEMWAKTKYRMIASGHFHTEKVQDGGGVVMHQFGTPKPSDPYEYANGYTMARKHLQLMEFNEERLVATYEVE